MQFCLDDSGTPQRALIFVSAALFDSIQDVFEDSDVVPKPGVFAEEQEAEGGESAFVVNLKLARLDFSSDTNGTPNQPGLITLGLATNVFLESLQLFGTDFL